MIDRFPQSLDGLAVLGRLDGPDVVLRLLQEGVSEEEARYLAAVLAMLKERFPDDEPDAARSLH